VDEEGKSTKETSEEAKSEDETVEVLADQLHHHATIVKLNNHVAEVFTGTDEENEPNIQSCIENVRLAQQFIQHISAATLDDGTLDDEVVSRLQNPETGPIEFDADEQLSLDLFIGCKNTSQSTYNAVWDAILCCFPGTKVLSYHLVKNLAAKATRVVSVLDDMCINSCQAFTGPFADCTTCSVCGEERYADSLARKGQQPRQQVCTIPLGPQIQALR
jgi:hypothetical protein